MAERQGRGTDLDAVGVAEHGGLADAAAVEERAVAAAQIDEPVLVLLLRVNERVPARRAVVGERDLIGRRAPQRARADDGELFAPGIFQPAWGRLKPPALEY